MGWGRKAALGWAAVGATGGAPMACAAITGLSTYAEDEYVLDGNAPEVQDAAAVRPDVARAIDAVTEAMTEAFSRADARTPDADHQPDADPQDLYDADAQTTRAPDSRAQDESDAGESDADSGTPGEGGCVESSSSVASCSACGMGWDAEGCECATPACCGAGCETIHSNGEGQSFYDCAALDTYDQTQAMEACTAFTRDSVQCSLSATFCSSSSYSVCSVAASTCRCWQYSGPNPGTVQSSPLGCAAQCGSSSDPKWN